MKTLFAFILTSVALTSFSQDIIVDTVLFTETVDNTSQSKIPFVVDKSGTKTSIAEKINEGIKDRFMFDSFDPDKVTEFSWYDVDFQYEIKAGILLISFSGEYYGAYLNYVNDNLYFNLSDGNILEEKILPFNALFSLEGYFSFLKNYWLSGCNAEYDEAARCAEFEPYCNCYDLYFSSSGNNIVSFELTNDCFPHVAQGCSPYYSVNISTDSLGQYLSDFGLYVLLQTNYLNMTQLEKFLFYKDNFGKIPSYYFIVGSIDGKYPFSMAIELDEKTKKARGYYFYHKQNKPIKLEGEFDPTKIKLTESVNDKITGRFEFARDSKYEADGIYVGDDKYWSGKWFDTNNKELNIKLEDIKVNK